MKNPFLIGPRVYLRPYDDADVPLLTRWINDPEIREFIAWHQPITERAERDWVAASVRPGGLALMIVLREQDTPIGNLDMGGYADRNRCGGVGISVFEHALRGQGYGTEALGLLLKYAFTELNLNRVQLDVYAHNTRAIRSYEKCGFTREGTKRRATFVAGEWRDVHIYAILASEYRKG